MLLKIENEHLEEKNMLNISNYIEIQANSEKVNSFDKEEHEMIKNRSRNQSSNIVILVYSITDKNSFDQLNYWYNNVIKNIGNDIIIGIAANKCDLLEDEKVHAQEGINYAEKIGAVFKETTATQHEAIEELFEELSRKFVKKKNINETGNILLNNTSSKIWKYCCTRK